MSEVHASTVSAESLAGQFVIFTVADTELAVSMQQVEEILKPPHIVRVPLAPPAVQGVANLRGSVLPIVSVHTMFGIEDHANSKAQRVLVLNVKDHQIGFVVDSVKQVINVDANQISTEGVDTGLVSEDQLLGMIKMDDGHLHQILNFEQLCNIHLQTLMNSTPTAKLDNQRVADGSHEEKLQDEVQLISFTVQNQEFALPITDAKEIVNFPKKYSQVPNAPQHLVGLMTLRSRVMPLVSLRVLFGLPLSENLQRRRVLVVPLRNGRQGQIGLIVDDLKEVVRVNRNLIDDLPSVMSNQGNMDDISEVCRLDEGRRLISVIDAGRMLSHHLIQNAVESVADQLTEQELKDEDMDDRNGASTDGEQYIVFRLGGDEFGVRISSAKEIVRLPDKLTKVPNSPSFVEGIINLRGDVLPVVSKRVRFGMGLLERNERQRIVVYEINAQRVGFIVDSVSEVLRISNSDIRPAPELQQASSAGTFIDAVANLEESGRMIILIESSRLLDSNEKQSLMEMDV